MTRKLTCQLIAANCLLQFCVFDFAVRTTYAVSLEWVEQLGTPEADYGFGVSADGLGSVYISGVTQGNLGGSNSGSYDAFLAKYDSAGSIQWTRQLGTAASEAFVIGGVGDGSSVSADNLGNVYIAGSTGGSLGGPHAGQYDAFVAKYDAAGNPQWTRQLGTTANDVCQEVSADGLGNVYISGYTTGSLGGPNAGNADAYLSKYDTAGNSLWTEQLGTVTEDASRSVSADNLGNVFISGYTFGSLGGSAAGGTDAFVSEYNAAGNLQWTRQLGTASSDESNALSADGLGNVYIAGSTSGNLGGPNAGSSDAFVAKYDGAGTLQWTRQFGAAGQDEAFSVSTDGAGSVYVASYSTISGPQVSKYDAAGNFQWAQQLGSVGSEAIFGVSADGLQNVYVSGWTDRSLGGPSAGSNDAFVAKYSDVVVPEPTSVALLALAFFVFSVDRFRCGLYHRPPIARVQSRGIFLGLFRCGYTDAV